MHDPAELFQFETDTPRPDMQASVLLVALEGFVDAGHTQRLVTEHILATHQSTVVASASSIGVGARPSSPRSTSTRCSTTAVGGPS